MTDIKSEFKSLNSPVISVKIKDSGFSYECFGGVSVNIGNVVASGYYESSDLQDLSYAGALCFASSIIESALGASDCNTEACVEALIRLREELKEYFPILARQISEWICDICFICDSLQLIPQLCKEGLYDIPYGPEYLIYDWVYDILHEPFEKWSGDKLISALPYICRYDFTLSEYYRENTELYERVFVCALLPFVKNLISERGEEILTPKVKKACRTSFCGLTCSDRAVKIMEIEYLSFSECDAFFDALTSAVRYCDNLVRQSLSASSKLMGIGLLPEQRKLISESLRGGIPGLLAPLKAVGRKPKKKVGALSVKAENAAKEKPSEPISLDVDFTKARELLEKSWILSELFDTGDEEGQIIYSENKVVLPKEEETKAVEESGTSQLSEWEEFILSLSDREREILRCILGGGDAASLSRSFGGMPLGFAHVINEKALESIGDIVIDAGDGKQLSVFEDYREILSEIMNKGIGGEI